MLRSVGLATDALDDPEGVITYLIASRLLEASVAHTGCQHFALLVGELANRESLGAVGRLMACAPDVGLGLAVTVSAKHLRDVWKSLSPWGSGRVRFAPLG